ncbi:hypothetical protein I6F66_21345, partial [Pseudoalteromonas sp. NZS100_1]|nr:hypothetical protein [Pseudoalteromonas sp. NZS100_1]
MGGKSRLGAMSKMGQSDIRKLLVVGAMSRIRWIVRKGVLPDHHSGPHDGSTAQNGGRRSTGE